MPQCLCIREDRWESNRNCLCGRKRKCDSRLTPLITDEEDSAELCCKFLLPQCGVCLMPSSLYYSRHTSERDSQSEKERSNNPLVSDISYRFPLCLLYNIRHLFSLSVFSCVNNIKQHGRELLSGTPGNCYIWLLPHEDPQLVPALMLILKEIVEVNLWVLTNAQHVNMHISWCDSCRFHEFFGLAAGKGS